MLLTLLSFCIHLAFTMDISMHMDTRYWCPFKRRSAAQLAVFIHFYRKGMGAKLPSWPLHVGIRSKGPLFRNLLVIWVILSASPIFPLAFFAKGQWEITKETSKMLTQCDNQFKQGNWKHSAKVWQAPVFLELTAYLTCLFWKHHAWSPWR